MMNSFCRSGLSFAVCWLATGCAAMFAGDAPRGDFLSDAISDRIVSVSQGWGELGLNTAVRPEGRQATRLRIKDKEYSHGLGHHAHGEIVVDLGGQFKEFHAEIGVQWQGGGNPASVVFQVFADDKKVFDSGVVHESDAPRPLAISVQGAKEMRLIATDAGDGISFDCANWADARLTRDPMAANESPDAGIDMAPFARIAWWDPQTMTGTKAKRVEEFPAEDIVSSRELLPSTDGSYQVPATNGTGCIGLEWDESRWLRRVVLHFQNDLAVPPAESVHLQVWTGASAWQGQWRGVEPAPQKLENSLAWTFGYQDLPRGTEKVRWVFSGARQPIVLRSVSAVTRSRSGQLGVRIEAPDSDAPAKAEIEVYNGVLLNPPQKSARHCVWDTSFPLTLSLRYAVPQRYKADRTVLRLRLPNAAFGVAIEDLLANDCVYVPHAGVFVTRVPAPVTMADHLKKKAREKSVMERVRELPDQDFARAWPVVHNPIQDLGPTMVSLANDTRKFTVEREGTIWFDEYDRPDDPRGARPGTIYELSYNLPWRCSPSFGRKSLEVTRHLQGEWLPIPVTTAVDGSVEYRQTTYVVPMSEATIDAPLWYRDRAACVGEYQVKNNGNTTAPARLALGFGHAKNKPFQLQKVKEGRLVVQGGRIMALVDTRNAAPLAVRIEGTSVVLSGELPGGAMARCSVVLPAWRAEAQDCASLFKAEDGAGRVEAYWTKLLEPAMQIEIPDRRLGNIIRASQAHCLLAARNERRGAGISAWTSGAQYGPLESESCAVIRGMDMAGHTDFARRSLEFLLSFRTREGFITTGYTMVGTGEILWTLGEHCDRARDRAWMRKVAPEVAQVCQWIIRQREKTKRFDARGQKVPEYGLMPPGVSADWDRYAYRLFNDAQFCAGLRAGARMLAEVEDPAAPAIREEANRYREDILRAFHSVQARTPVVRLGNGTWAPADPAFMNCFGRVEDFLPAEDANRTWGYSIDVGSHHLAATGVLDPASRDADWMIDYLEDVQFLRTGWGDYPEARNRKDVFCYGGFAKVQPYYCRIAELHAMRDDVKPFIRSYFNTIGTLVSAENLAFWEHFANRGMWNKTHETGWFLCQTRMMFAKEQDGDLWLAPFLTTHWMKDGMKVAVRNIPTRFGTAGYTILSKVANGQIEAVVQLPRKLTAQKVVLRLRHPEGKPIRSVVVQNRPHADFNPDKDTITFTPGDETVVVRATY